MLVIEIANDAQKHVFERNLGAFPVSLRALPDGHVVLSVKDESGPGWSPTNSGDTRAIPGPDDPAEPGRPAWWRTPGQVGQRHPGQRGVPNPVRQSTGAQRT